MNSYRLIHSLAAFLHGVLWLGHAMGLLYNFFVRNRFETVAHGAWFAFDGWATRKHVRKALDVPEGVSITRYLKGLKR